MIEIFSTMPLVASRQDWGKAKVYADEPDAAEAPDALTQMASREPTSRQ